MDSPYATQNISTGMLGSIDPVGVKPRRPDRWPSWKTHTRQPSITDRLSRFSTVAFRGSSTLPVIRKRITYVATSTMPTAIGSRSRSVARKSVVSPG